MSAEGQRTGSDPLYGSAPPITIFQRFSARGLKPGRLDAGAASGAIVAHSGRLGGPGKRTGVVVGSGPVPGCGAGPGTSGVISACAPCPSNKLVASNGKQDGQAFRLPQALGPVSIKFSFSNTMACVAGVQFSSFGNDNEYCDSTDRRTERQAYLYVVSIGSIAYLYNKMRGVGVFLPRRAAQALQAGVQPCRQGSWYGGCPL